MNRECPTRFHKYRRGTKGRYSDVPCRVKPVRHNPARPDLALYGSLLQEEEAFSQYSGLGGPVLILRALSMWIIGFGGARASPQTLYPL